MLRRLMLGLALASVLSVTGIARAAANSPNAQTRVALDRVLPAVTFHNVTLRDALDFLRDVSGANFHINWKAIEAAGVTGDTQVNLKLRQVTLRKVLGMLLQEASGGTTLTFYVDDGVVEITTRDIADAVMLTVVYRVQDLLAEPPDYQQPPMMGGLQATGRSDTGSGYRNSGYRNSGSRRDRDFAGNGNQTNNNAWWQTSLFKQPDAKTGKGKSDELISLITEAIYPSVWPPVGKASIKFFEGNLIVTAPRSVHEALGGPID